MNKSIATIILILVVVGGGFFAYSSLFNGSAEPVGDANTAAAAAGTDAGTKLLALLDRLQSLKLNGSVLKSPQFLSLKDETTMIANEPVGRNNPFAPIGHDSGFVASASTITATVAATTSSKASGSKPVTATSTATSTR